MTGTAPTNSELEIAELSQLAEAKMVDLTGELATCSALLIRLGTTFNISSLEPRSKASVLRLVFMDIVDRAYAEVIENKPDQAMARQVLTVGALIGIVPEWPNSGNRRPSAMRQQRGTDKTARRVTAAKWAGVSDRTLAPDRRPDDYAKAFQNAFHDFLADEQAITNLARRHNIAIQAHPDPTAERTKASNTNLPRLGQAPRKARGRTTYVRRDVYHDRITELINSGEPVVVLGGDRGNGKSRLALEYVLASLAEDERYVYLNGISPTTDLMAILATWGISFPEEVNIQSLAPFFANLAGMQGGPRFVIIDNVEDIELLDTLLPSSSLSTIIVTTHLRIPGYDEATIKVKEMDELEAFELAKTMLPNEGDVDLKNVVYALGFRPLAIVHACGFIIGKGTVDIPKFLEDLSAKTSETLDVPAGAGEKTLTALYAMMLDNLARADRVAMWSIFLIAHVGDRYIPKKLIELSLSELPSKAEITSTRFSRAILALETRYLIEEEEAFFSIHPLTQKIIRDAYAAQAPSKGICSLLHRQIAPPAHYSVGRIERDLPISYLNNAYHLLAIVSGLTDLSSEERAKISLDYTLAVLLKACGQLGYRSWFLHLRSIFPDLRNPEEWPEYPSMTLAYLENSWLAFNGGLLCAPTYATALEILADMVKSNNELTADIRLRIQAAQVALEDYPVAYEMLGEVRDSIKREKGAHQPRPRIVKIEPTEANPVGCTEIQMDAATAPDYIGDHTLLGSEIMLGVGNLSRVTNMAMDAYLAYIAEQDMPGRGKSNRSLVMRACLVHLEASLFSGHSAADLNAAFAMLRNEWEPGTGDAGLLVQGRYWLARLRLEGNSLLYRYAYVGMDDAWKADARSFLAQCSVVWDDFHNAIADRELMRNSYEWTLIGCLENPALVDLARSHAEDLERSQNWLTLAQVKIAFAKLDLLYGRATPQHVYEFKELAYRIAIRHGAGYWFTEALSVAAAAAAWCEMPWQGMILPLDEGHSMTQRHDKNRALGEAVYVGSENPQVFKKKIAYLLGL